MMTDAEFERFYWSLPYFTSLREMIAYFAATSATAEEAWQNSRRYAIFRLKEREGWEPIPTEYMRQEVFKAFDEAHSSSPPKSAQRQAPPPRPVLKRRPLFASLVSGILGYVFQPRECVRP